MHSVRGSLRGGSALFFFCGYFLLIGFASQGLAQAALEQPATPLPPSPESNLESLFYETLQTGTASQAEEVLTRFLAEPGPKDSYNVPQMFLSMGNHYSELSVPAKAEFWFEKLIAEYGSKFADEETKVTYKELISNKLTWLKSGGKRPWAQSDPTGLAKKISEALRAADVKSLDALLAQVDTYVGWWESEYEFTPRDGVLEHIRKYQQTDMKWVNVEAFQNAIQSGEKTVYVNTHGWKDMEGFKNIQFAIHQVPEGWEWRGIVLGE